MKILVIAPHPDDEILGVGGTIAKYTAQGDEVYVCVVTKGTMPFFSEEGVKQVREECCIADEKLGVKETIFLDFPAVKLEEIQRFELNNAILSLIQRILPDEVYLPHRGDMQLDHKITVDASMVALRPKYNHIVTKIYAYETLSETGWNIPNSANEFIPNVYNDISEFIELKIDALSTFKSQIEDYPNARSLQSVKALSMYRGSIISVDAAEVFSLIREIKL